MNARKYSGIKPTRQDYCQFIMATLINYTQTYMADHHPLFSHDAINRFLMEDEVSPATGWQAVRKIVLLSNNACIIFDDTVADKRHSFKIELVRRQYSGNAHGIVKGIGVVNCLYVNLDTDEYWIIDWRIYDPDSDGKTKLDHVKDMFDDAIHNKSLPFRAVLMDSWYAAKDLMMQSTRPGNCFTARSKPTVKWMTAKVKTPIRRFLGWTGSMMKCYAESK